MIVTCPECSTEYRLDAGQLGAEGRNVRCTSCLHVWFQTHVPEEDISRVIANAEQEPDIGVGAAPSPDLVFEEKPAEPPPPTEDFALVLKEVQEKKTPAPAPAPARTSIPDAVMPLPAEDAMPALPVWKPMGMGEWQFGAMCFLVCFFSSVLVLLALKGPLVRAQPALATLYQAVGMPVHAPGEGLRIDNLAASRSVEKTASTLTVTAKVVNISDEEMTMPPLQLVLKNDYGAVMKEETLPEDESKTLAPGASLPVEIAFKDAPDDVIEAQIKVVAE